MRIFTEEHRKKLSLAHSNQVPWNKGKKLTEEHKQNLVDSHLRNPTRYWLGKKRPDMNWDRNLPKGENHWNWRGGINSINDTIRKSVRYKEWRDAVFERDDYTCQGCGQKGGRLNADHIMPFSLFEAVRFYIENGRTFCEPCHKEYGWKYRPSASAQKN